MTVIAADEVQGHTLAARMARRLIGLSLECADGDFLGSEDALCACLGVSRPTLRQAARIAESRRMICVRRGSKGGIYAARPDAGDAIGTLTGYLRMRGATMSDILVLSRLVSQEAAERAAQCTDLHLRGEMERFAAAIDGHDSARAMILVEGELAQLIARMSGNPALELVMAIGLSFGMDEESDLFSDPAQRAEARKLQHELCRAVLEGDEEIAGLMMRRRSLMIRRWLDAPLRQAE